ncbi:AaceriADR020Cp [[Ashbya] aceris (nom. inval.)]|nr:AaceriADR020Cp [[Ashbya] aceris (nom. inval.)]
MASKHVQRRRRPSLHTLLAACMALLLLWWMCSPRSSAVVEAEQDHGLKTASQFTPLSRADVDNRKSPFYRWEEKSLRMRCKTYFEQVHNIHPQWANRMLEKLEDQTFRDIIASLAMERLRVYDECFISGALPLDESLFEPIKRRDFDSRMFPFLAPAYMQDRLWPTVFNATSGKIVRSMLKISTGELYTIREERSFWYNWQQFSNGRGIAVWVNEELVDSFKALLAVLDHLGNTLPVQLVHRDSDLPWQVFEDLAAHIQKHTRQQVYFVDCTTSLRWRWLKFKKVPPARLVALFNSFEEVILMDVTAVPFVPPEALFALPEYTATGALFFKGRGYDYRPYAACLQSLDRLKPSAQEARLWSRAAVFNSSFAYPGNASAANPGRPDPAAAELLLRGRVDNIDEALVVINKPRSLTALLAAALLAIQPTQPRCAPHARNVLWLSLHMSAQPYAIHPAAAGALGEPESFPAAAADRYVVCGPQLAHVDSRGTLLWASGGLRRCHPADPHRDFRDNYDYFRPNYGRPEELAEFYALPLRVQAFLAPAPGARWEPRPDCARTTHCLTVYRQPSEDVMLGTLLRFGQAELGHYANLTRIWNNALPAFLPQA